MFFIFLLHWRCSYFNIKYVLYFYLHQIDQIIFLNIKVNVLISVLMFYLHHSRLLCENPERNLCRVCFRSLINNHKQYY